MGRAGNQGWLEPISCDNPEMPRGLGNSPRRPEVPSEFRPSSRRRLNFSLNDKGRDCPHPMIICSARVLNRFYRPFLQLFLRNGIINAPPPVRMYSGAPSPESQTGPAESIENHARRPLRVYRTIDGAEGNSFAENGRHLRGSAIGGNGATPLSGSNSFLFGRDRGRGKSGASRFRFPVGPHAQGDARRDGKICWRRAGARRKYKRNNPTTRAVRRGGIVGDDFPRDVALAPQVGRLPLEFDGAPFTSRIRKGDRYAPMGRRVGSISS